LKTAKRRQAKDLNWEPEIGPMTIVIPADLMRQLSVDELLALCVMKERLIPSLEARVEARRTGKPVLVRT
jgi:hypothetical protein